LNEQLVNGLSLGESVRAAGHVADLRRRVQAETGEDRSGQVSGADRVGVRVGADLVASAVDDTPLDAAAGQDDAKAAGPVVTARRLVDLRGAAELADPDHQG